MYWLDPAVRYFETFTATILVFMARTVCQESEQDHGSTGNAEGKTLSYMPRSDNDIDQKISGQWTSEWGSAPLP